jgi:transposase
MDDLNFPGWRSERSIQVVEADAQTRVLVKGQLYMSWRSGDEACVRLAITQLHQCGLATEQDLAEVFGRHVTTVQRYLRDFADEGVEGLVSERRGPKGRWKLTPGLRGKILLIVLREGVWGLEAIQQRLLEAWHEAVSVPSIQQVLEDNGLGEPINQGGGGEGVQGELFGLQQEHQLVLGLEGGGTQPRAELGASSEPQQEPMAEGSAGGQEVGMVSRRNYSSAQRVYLDQLEQGAYNGASS